MNLNSFFFLFCFVNSLPFSSPYDLLNVYIDPTVSSFFDRKSNKMTSLVPCVLSAGRWWTRQRNYFFEMLCASLDGAMWSAILLHTSSKLLYLICMLEVSMGYGVPSFQCPVAVSIGIFSGTASSIDQNVDPRGSWSVKNFSSSIANTQVGLKAVD